MKKHLKTFLAGAFIIIPFAITIYVIWAIGSGLDGLVQNAVDAFTRGTGGKSIALWPAVGTVLVIGLIYCVGLLTRFWLFRSLLDIIENLFERLPVVKTIYEWIRDVMQLFGSQAKRMGRVVSYKMPNSDVTVLGILTNDKPKGLHPEDTGHVAVYFPLGYMMGGIVAYLPPEKLKEVDIPVEEALKLSATAQVTSQPKIDAQHVVEDPGIGGQE